MINVGSSGTVTDTHFQWMQFSRAEGHFIKAVLEVLHLKFPAYSFSKQKNPSVTQKKTSFHRESSKKKLPEKPSLFLSLPPPPFRMTHPNQ